MPMRVPTDSIDTDYHGGSLSGTFGLVIASVYDGQVGNGHVGIHQYDQQHMGIHQYDQQSFRVPLLHIIIYYN
jgi:hypothetical protein